MLHDLSTYIGEIIEIVFPQKSWANNSGIVIFYRGALHVLLYETAFPNANPIANPKVILINFCLHWTKVLRFHTLVSLRYENLRVRVREK
jgi:hypothetical protein